MKYIMKRKSTTSIILILLGLVAILLSMAVLEPPLEVLLEAPWDKEGHWATDSTVDLDDNAMILYGREETSRFTLADPKGGLLISDKNELKILSFKLMAKNVQDFKILVHLVTTEGHVYFHYDPVNYKRGRYNGWNNYNRGLGKDKINGNWHLVFTDMKEDLKNISPSAKILGVKGIRFTIPKGNAGGNLLVNNIGCLFKLPKSEKITEPRWEWTQEHKYKNERIIEQTTIYYDEFGEAIKTTAQLYNYDEKGNKKSTISTYYNSDNEIIGSCESKNPKTNYDITWLSWTDGKDGNLKKNAITLWRSKGDNFYYMILYKGNNVMCIYEIHQILDESGYTNIYEFYKPTLSKRWDGRTIEEAFKEIDINNPDFNYQTFFDGLLTDFDCQFLGEVTRASIKEKGNYIESISTSKDPSGNIISTDTRFHSEPFWSPQGKWGVKEYSNGKVTRYKNLSGNRWIGLGMDSRLECDYDEQEGQQMKYYIYSDEYNLSEIWTIAEGKITRDIYDPTNLDTYNTTLVTGWEEDSKILSQENTLTNLVIGGDMRRKRPFWIQDKKTKCEIIYDGLRIERIHKDEEPDQGPGYASQYIPVQGGEYKIIVEYRREFGEAHIRGDWVALENLWTRDKPDEFAENLFDFKDIHNAGTRIKEVIFTTPDEPGLLILKIGAASAVVYNHVDLRPYRPESLADAVETTETTPQSEVEQNGQIQPAEEYSYMPTTAQEAYSGNIDTHVNGGYIILKVEDDVNEEIDENETVAEQLPGGDIKHIRTTVGSDFCKVIEKEPGVSNKELETILPRYRRKEAIASTKKGGSHEHLSYGLRLGGSGVDEVVGIETGKKLYKIKPYEYNNIAPASLLSKRDKNRRGIGYMAIRAILRFNDWFTNLIRRFKRKVVI